MNKVKAHIILTKFLYRKFEENFRLSRDGNRRRVAARGEGDGSDAGARETAGLDTIQPNWMNCIP